MTRTNDNLHELNTLINKLICGWDERVKYATRTKTCTDECNRHKATLTIPQLRHHECGCPEILAHVAGHRRQPPILTQLIEAGYTVPAQSTPGRSSNKPGSRPPGNLLRPDEILRNIAVTAGTICRTWAIDTDPAGVDPYLRAILDHAPRRADEEIADALHALRGAEWKALVFLGYSSEYTYFTDTACGECGGTLRVARDQPTDVRCAGTAAAPPCGMVYPWHTWMALLQGQPTAVKADIA